MNSIVEVHPKKSAYDPLAHQVRSELIEMGESVSSSVVSTNRLYKINGDLTPADIEKVAQLLLVDPVVETIHIVNKESPKNKSKGTGFVLDVWPKPGVTDPVGETVRKGIRDLGLNQDVKASSAYRYIFPKIKDQNVIKKLAKQFLANELIHDIHIRKN